MIFIEAEDFEGKAYRLIGFLWVINAARSLSMFIGGDSRRKRAAKFTVNLIVNNFMQVSGKRKRRQCQNKAKQ